MRCFNVSMTALMALGLAAATMAAPATQPATQPAEVPAARTTEEGAALKAVVKSFLAALNEGNAEAAQAMTAAGNDQQRQSVQLMVLMIGSQKHLSEAAEKQFGREKGQIITAQHAQYERNLRQVDEATVQIDGDTATLSSADQKQPLQLKREEGQWKIDLSAMPGLERLSQMSGVVRALVQASNQTADDITAGKFATVEEAKSALNQRMMRVMMESGHSTTRPTTR